MTLMAQAKPFSPQEDRVLDLARQGLGDKQIALELGLSADTVRTYWQRMRHKIGATNRTEILASINERETGELRAAEAKWRRLADSMPQMVYIARPDGHFYYFNARFYEYTGATPEEASGEGFFTLIHPKDLPEFQSKLAHSLVTAEPFECEARVRNHDGAYRWHMNRAVPYIGKRNAVICWYATSTDIHESKLIRDKLQTSEARLITAQRMAGLGYYEYRVDTLEGRWSQNLFDLFEMPHREGWFDSSDFLNLMEPDDIPHLLEGIRKTLTEGVPFDEIYRVNLPSGRQIYVHSIARAILEDGKVVKLVGTIQDITKSKQIDLALQHSEQRFRAITEASPHGIFLTDAQGDCVYKNARYEEISGIPHEAKGKDWVAAIHPQDREWLVDAWYSAAVAGQPFEAEYRYRLPSGEDRWVFTKTVAITLDGGHTGHLGVVEDITARKAAEAERQRLIGIIEITPDIVWMSDPDLNVIDMNASARQFFGIADAASLRLDRVYPAWALDKVRKEGIPEAIRCGTWTGETAFLDAAGQEVSISQVILAHHDRDGNLSYLSSVARDISDYKKINHELEEQRRFMEKIFNANYDIIYIYDCEKRHPIFMNRAMGTALGYTSEEMYEYGRDVARKLVHPDDLDALREHRRRMLDVDDDTVIEHEYRVVSKAGEWRWMHVRESVFRRDPSGKVALLLGVAQDVTHLRVAK